MGVCVCVCVCLCVCVCVCVRVRVCGVSHKATRTRILCCLVLGAIFRVSMRPQHACVTVCGTRARRRVGPALWLPERREEPPTSCSSVHEKWTPRRDIIKHPAHT